MIRLLLLYFMFSVRIFAVEEFALKDECRGLPSEIPASLKNELENFFFTPSMYYAAQDIIIGLQKVLKEENEQKRNELYREFEWQGQCLRNFQDQQMKAYEKVFGKKLVDYYPSVGREDIMRFDNYVHYFAQYIYVEKVVNKKYKLKSDYTKTSSCNSSFYKRYQECGNQLELDIKAMEKLKSAIRFDASDIDTEKLISRFDLLKDQRKNFKALLKHIDRVRENKAFRKNEQAYISQNVKACFDSIAQRNQFLLEQKAFYIQNTGGRDQFLRVLVKELYLNTKEKRDLYYKNLVQKKQFRFNSYDLIDPNNPYCSFPFDNTNMFR